MPQQGGMPAACLRSLLEFSGALRGDTQRVRIDLTFAGDHELADSDGSDLAETVAVAYHYPPGAIVDLATFAVTERTISYWIAGNAATVPVPMASPDPVQVEVHPSAADRWVGVFDAQLTSPRGVNCAVALPDRNQSRS